MKLGNGSDNNNNNNKKRKSQVQAVFSQAAECTLASFTPIWCFGRGGGRGGYRAIGGFPK